MPKKVKILLTEDVEINQEIFMGLLEGTNISVDIAVNGQEAVQKFREKKYALIVMDIEMPIMDGYEATRIIRAEDNETPIIALTANNSHDDKIRTKQLGMNAHLSKPIEPQVLYQAFSQYLF